MAVSESMNTEFPTKGDFEYKKELAHKLVKRFGLAAAKQTCIDNQWHGVLQVVNTVRSH